MAPRVGEKIGLVTLVVVMLCSGAAAQSRCNNVIITLAPCLDYITGNTTTPSSDCCTQLANVVRSQVPCLCEILNLDGSQFGLNINRTLALTLPGACNVQTPPISTCNATSPADSPASPRNFPLDPSGNRTSNIPTTGDDKSDGSSFKLPLSLSFFLLFIASYASIFTSF